MESIDLVEVILGLLVPLGALLSRWLVVQVRAIREGSGARALVRQLADEIRQQSAEDSDPGLSSSEVVLGEIGKVTAREVRAALVPVVERLDRLERRVDVFDNAA